MSIRWGGDPGHVVLTGKDAEKFRASISGDPQDLILRIPIECVTVHEVSQEPGKVSLVLNLGSPLISRS
jgi:hypothetical protein